MATSFNNIVAVVNPLTGFERYIVKIRPSLARAGSILADKCLPIIITLSNPLKWVSTNVTFACSPYPIFQQNVPVV